jgi:hypothetical protein
MVKKRSRQLMLLFAWIGVSLLGLGLYKQEIYDHYYSIFFPAIFILIGVISQYLIKNTQKLKYLVIAGLAVLVFLNLKYSPTLLPPNRQLQRTREVAEKIKEESGGEMFNLAVIAERNYEDAYQYFLEKWNTKVTDIDSQNIDSTLATKLFVVCELPEEKCDPTHSDKAEVANFGWSQIKNQWNVAGTTLYELGPSDFQ